MRAIPLPDFVSRDGWGGMENGGGCKCAFLRMPCENGRGHVIVPPINIKSMPKHDGNRARDVQEPKGRRKMKGVRLCMD